ncbi:MAG TPA: hypothetical protein VF070_32355 [Streptosporangiaceae bacterium]
MDVAALDASGAGAVVLTPAHQWPTGAVLAPEQRLALIDWATRRDALVIEDDYDAEFRYDRDPRRCPAGTHPRPGDLPGHGQQVPGARVGGWAGSSARPISPRP